MVDFISLIVGYTFLGFVIMQVTEIIKKIINNYKEKETWIPFILALFFSYGCGLNLIQTAMIYLGIELSVNVYLDMFITAVILSQGANSVYELIDYISQLRAKRLTK